MTLIEINTARTAECDHPRNDAARGYLAGLLGRGELDTIGLWGRTANTLVRASYFNMGVRAAQNGPEWLKGRRIAVSDLSHFRERYPGARPDCLLAAAWRLMMERELGRPLVYDVDLGDWR